jgi:hypothetical protein
MSRSGYVDDYDEDYLQMGRWRGMVASAIRGRRGQTLLKEMLAAMDAMPIKRLVANELEAPDLIPCSHWGLYEATGVCAIGTVGRARGVDMTKLDPEDYDSVAGTFDIAAPLAQEIVWMNDEAGPRKETPEARFIRIRSWVVKQIRAPAQSSPQEIGEPQS